MKKFLGMVCAIVVGMVPGVRAFDILVINEAGTELNVKLADYVGTVLPGGNPWGEDVGKKRTLMPGGTRFFSNYDGKYHSKSFVKRRNVRGHVDIAYASPHSQIFGTWRYKTVCTKALDAKKGFVVLLKRGLLGFTHEVVPVAADVTDSIKDKYDKHRREVRRVEESFVEIKK